MTGRDDTRFYRKQADKMLDGYPIIDEFTCEDVGLVWSDFKELESDPNVIDDMMERLVRDLQTE